MKKRSVVFLVITAILLCSVAISAIALSLTEKPIEVLKYIVGLSEVAPEYADANGDGKINILDVIALEKDARIKIVDSNGDEVTSEDVIEIENGAVYTISVTSTVSDSDEVTISTSNNKVATVDQDGKITAINPGECVIKAEGTSGKTESVNVVVYEVVSEMTTYRWDFNDLTETYHGNDLTLNPALPANAAKNYSFSNGMYVASSSATTYERPDFIMDTPITLDSTRDFTVEWRGTMPNGTGHTILGQNPENTSNDSDANGHIYISPSANWKSSVLPDPTYAVKFKPETGSQILLPFTEYHSTMISADPVTWKINYVAATKKMTLAFSTDDGANWTQTCEVTVGTFSSTYESIFGRTTNGGKYNYRGTMDYIEVKCYGGKKVTNHDNLEVMYRWDFNDLTETYNGNDLTLDDTCPTVAATNYTIANGSYKVKASLKDLEKPTFEMETPFTLSNTQDWSVQWKGNFSNTGTVMGHKGSDITSTGSTSGHIYISPNANWTSSKPYKTYAVKFQYTSKNYILLPFTEFQSVMKSMSTWRIEYDAATKKATLLFSQNDGADWTVASVTSMPNFSTEFTNIFGRTVQNGNYNFNSEMDYIQVSLGKTDTTNGIALNSLTLDDDNYALTYTKNKTDYTVYLPEGHPAVPRIEATAADGLTVEVQQAYIPDGETEGTAYAVVSNGEGKSATYTVKFVKTESVGFVLQFDDRYTFTPDYKLKDGESFTYESSNTTVLTVDGNGLMTAVKRSYFPITVTAKVGDTVVDTLVIDRIEKAHVNLFFITGQSNGQGCYDTVNYDGTTETEGNEWMVPYATQLSLVEKIGGEGRVYSYDVHPRAENVKAGLPEAYTFYDMNNYQKQGHSAPLGKAYYDLTGEKVVFLQSAWSGAPIESWLDPDRYEEAGGYGIATRNFYQTTKDGYEKLTAILASDYEIILKANFWCQGCTAMTAYYDKSISNYIFSGNADFDNSKLITDKTYYEYFMRIDRDMREDYGLDYNGIMFTKTKGEATDNIIVPIISAHFGLVNNNENIFTATRTFIEIATQYKTGDPTKEGYGFMGTDGAKGNHYNQIGYNYHGKEAANNLFGVVYKPFETAKDIELIDNDGLTRLDSEDSFEIMATASYRLGALPLPHYIDENITWTTSNKYVATVDEYGVVRGVAAGNAVITATTDSGKQKSVNVSVYETEAEKVEYHWEFNDLTDSVGDNDLTLNAGNYSLTETGYKSISASADLIRADFAFTTPIELNSSMDWSIEWKGYIQGGSTFLGQLSSDPTSTDETKGHIYCSPYANWGSEASPKYAIKFKPDNRSQILLAYTDYNTAMMEMNCWKIEYSAESNTMKLLLSQDDGANWTETCSVTAGEFTFNAEALFGRTRQNGQYNFNGELDYLKVNCYKFTKVTDEDKIGVTYRWDFDDLTDSVGGNDLTFNPACTATAAKKYTISNGIYSVSKNTADTDRPDFVLKEAFTVDSTKNWEIEWRGYFYWAGTIFGTSSEDTTTNDVINNGGGYIYITPSGNWGSTANPKYAIRVPSGQGYVLLPFTGYQAEMKEMNNWRMSYDVSTGAITISLSTDNGGSWLILSETKMGEFSYTYTNMFGRYYCNGRYDFIGEMDYVQVSIAK